MISIYLCDDDQTWLNLLRKSIEAFIVQKDADMKIVYTSTNPEELLNYLSSNSSIYSIYFLDVDLKAKINGMELANKIRKIDPRGFIIFVTIHDEMAIETFKLKLAALDYVVKDGTDVNKRANLQNQIFSCLNHIEDLLQNNSKIISGTIGIRSCGSNFIIFIDDIIYVETVKGFHKSRVHLKDGVIETSCSLKNMQARLGDDFFRSHKSYILNLRHIKEIIYTRGEIRMNNEALCPCSTRTLSKLQQKIQELNNALRNHF